MPESSNLAVFRPPFAHWPEGVAFGDGDGVVWFAPPSILCVQTHAARVDLRMAEVLEALSPRGRRLDDARYAQAYRAVGLPRLRGRQIDLIREVGHGLGRALRLPGIGTLLRMSRGPAHAAGLAELQGFLERGVAAFRELRDVDAVLADIERSERRIAARIAAGHPDPFEEA